MTHRTPRTTRRLAAAAFALAALAACSDDPENAARATTTSAADGTTSTEAAAEETTTTGASAEETTTTEAPAEETTTTIGDVGDDGPAIPTDPQAYAELFVEAWAAGDQPTAEVLGTDDAVATIFAFEGGGTWTVESCDGAAGSTYCTFTAGGDPTLVVRVTNELAAQSSPDAVTEVQVSG